MTVIENPQKCCDFGWILNVDKPVGKTSFAVVSYIRKLSKIRKVGHAGSLDPNASGVLLIAVGNATKQVQQLMNLDKEYVGTFRFGLVTDTYDCEGTILEEQKDFELSEDAITVELQKFSGTIRQIPPNFSALKYKGEPLYKYARRGDFIEVKPREVHVSKIELEKFNFPEAVIRIICSRGTYIRSIAHDLGRLLGCGAILSALTRERIGDYLLKNALTWEDLPESVEKLL